MWDESTSQEAVFESCESFATSILQGTNICILTHGPTGTGKSVRVSLRFEIGTKNLGTLENDKLLLAASMLPWRSAFMSPDFFSTHSCICNIFSGLGSFLPVYYGGGFR